MGPGRRARIEAGAGRSTNEKERGKKREKEKKVGTVTVGGGLLDKAVGPEKRQSELSRSNTFPPAFFSFSVLFFPSFLSVGQTRQ